MFDRAKAALLTRAVASFLGEVPGAIRNHVNVQELARVAVAALLAGGGAWGVAAAVATHLPQIVTPDDLVLATAAVTALSELRRRLGQGAPVPTLPTPPAPSKSFPRTA